MGAKRGTTKKWLNHGVSWHRVTNQDLYHTPGNKSRVQPKSSCSKQETITQNCDSNPLQLQSTAEVRGEQSGLGEQGLHNLPFIRLSQEAAVVANQL